MFICFCGGFTPGLENWSGYDPPHTEAEAESLWGRMELGSNLHCATGQLRDLI